jgi:hypothetical protein
MEKMIGNQYILDLFNKNLKALESAHIVLDRVLALSAQKFQDADIQVNEKNQLFLIPLSDTEVINIGMDTIAGTVVIAAGTKDEIYARILISQEGIVDEQYKKFPNMELRNLIRGYFDALGNVDYVSELNIPEETYIRGDESEEDNDDAEIHFTGEDDE